MPEQEDGEGGTLLEQSLSGARGSHAPMVWPLPTPSQASTTSRWGRPNRPRAGGGVCVFKYFEEGTAAATTNYLET